MNKKTKLATLISAATVTAGTVSGIAFSLAPKADPFSGNDTDGGVTPTVLNLKNADKIIDSAFAPYILDYANDCIEKQNNGEEVVSFEQYIESNTDAKTGIILKQTAVNLGLS
jgi:hypothetical protein